MAAMDVAPAATVNVDCPNCGTPVTVALSFETYKMANSTMLRPIADPPLEAQFAEHECQETAGGTDLVGKVLG